MPVKAGNVSTSLQEHGLGPVWAPMALMYTVSNCGEQEVVGEFWPVDHSLRLCPRAETGGISLLSARLGTIKSVMAKLLPVPLSVN